MWNNIQSEKEREREKSAMFRFLAGKQIVGQNLTPT